MVSLLMILTACYAVGFVGSYAVIRDQGFWYVTTARPAWALPPGYFVPVWTAAYALIGIAGWQISPPRPRLAVALCFAQIPLAVLWSWCFFGWHKPLIATLAVLAVGIAAVGATILARPVLRWTLPVLLWAAYLVALSAAVWRMNRG